MNNRSCQPPAEIFFLKQGGLLEDNECLAAEPGDGFFSLSTQEKDWKAQMMAD